MLLVCTGKQPLWGNGPVPLVRLATTMDFLCSLVALDQTWTGSPQPNPALLCWILPMTSLCCSQLTAWSTSCWALHMRPVRMINSALFTALSLDSFSSNTRRVFSRLYLRLMDFKEAEEHSCWRGLYQRSSVGGPTTSWCRCWRWCPSC